MEPEYNKEDQLVMPDIGVVEEETKEEPKPLSDADQIKLLNSQVADLTKAAVAGARESSEREERMMGMISQTLGSQQVPPVVQQVQAPEPASFPDPVEDNEGFNKALMDTITKAVGQSVGAVQAANQQVQVAQTSVDTLWREFTTAYPEQAKHPEIVKSVYRDKEVQLQSKMGVDPKGFMKDVAAGVDVILDSVRGEKKEPDKEEPNRTGGISGDGSMAGSGVENKADKDEGSFVDEIKEAQAKGGYY